MSESNHPVLILPSSRAEADRVVDALARSRRLSYGAGGSLIVAPTHIPRSIAPTGGQLFVSPSSAAQMSAAEAKRARRAAKAMKRSPSALERHIAEHRCVGTYCSVAEGLL